MTEAELLVISFLAMAGAGLVSFVLAEVSAKIFNNREG
jgi:hypothetical protein